MKARVVEFRVGVLVLVSLALAIILTMLFGDMPSFLRPTYTIYVKFPDARGVREGSPVRKSGVLIGRVTDIEFAGQGVRLALEINEDVTLDHSDVCQIRTSILGDAELHFVPASPTEQTEQLAEPEAAL